MSGITIRCLEKNDKRNVAHLIPQLTENIVEEELLPDWIEYLVDYCAPWECIVAERKRIVIGFGQLVWYPIPSKKWVGSIEEIIVDRNYRRQGVGKMIIEKLIQVAKARKLNQLYLRVANPHAQALYESFGFKKRDELSMALRLFP